MQSRTFDWWRLHDSAANIFQNKFISLNLTYSTNGNWTFLFYLRKPVVSIQRGFDTSRFDPNSSSMKLHKNFDYFTYSLRVNKKNILGEYSSFFKLGKWKYLQLHWINLYRNDFVSVYQNGFVLKRLCIETKANPIFIPDSWRTTCFSPH